MSTIRNTGGGYLILVADVSSFVWRTIFITGYSAAQGNKMQ